jgi:hypothetical protein
MGEHSPNLVTLAIRYYIGGLEVRCWLAFGVYLPGYSLATVFPTKSYKLGLTRNAGQKLKR